MISCLCEDFQRKAEWVYGDSRPLSVAKALFTDGSAAMLLYRTSQTLRAARLGFLGAVLLKIASVVSQAVIGRGASFGPGFVILHSTGVVINGKVVGGRNIFIEHGVTIGEEKRGVPRLGDDVFVGAGAKLFGPISVGSRVKIGANAVVLRDVPDDSTAVGVPARIIPRGRESAS